MIDPCLRNSIRVNKSKFVLNASPVLWHYSRYWFPDLSYCSIFFEKRKHCSAWCKCLHNYGKKWGINTLSPRQEYLGKITGCSDTWCADGLASPSVPLGLQLPRMLLRWAQARGGQSVLGCLNCKQQPVFKGRNLWGRGKKENEGNRLHWAPEKDRWKRGCWSTGEVEVCYGGVGMAKAVRETPEQ